MKEVSKKESALREKITKHFLSIGVDPSHLSQWWSLGQHEYPRTVATLQKIWKNRPSKTTFQEWCKAPKGKFTSLQGTSSGGLGVRYPLLCGWTQLEVIEALKPFIFDLTKKYSSTRCEASDCYQNGAIGVVHALRTDAGMSAFASHAHPRIRTMIRRKSASSGIIAQPERRPSRTEVRRMITAWMKADMLPLEQDIRIQGGKKYEDLKKPEQKRIRKLAEEALISLSKKGAPINKTNLTNESMLAEYSVMKIGKRDVTELHIKENIRLDVLPLDKMLDLFDFLEVRFHCTDKQLLDFDIDKFQTVADVINRIADSPDFHGNPVPLSVEVDDGYSLHEAIPDNDAPIPYQQAIRNEDMERAKVLVEQIRQSITLTPAQELTMVYLYGLDGKNPMQGSELAERFGELSGEEPIGKDKNGNPIFRGVSRQRIMQHHKIVQKKIKEAAGEIFLQDKKILKTAIKKADLNKKQVRLATWYFGVDVKKMDIPAIADNYEDVIGSELPPSLKQNEREYIVAEMVREVKQILVGASL